MINKNYVLFAIISVVIGAGFAFSIKYLTPDISILKKYPNLFSLASLGASLFLAGVSILIGLFDTKKSKIRHQNNLLTGARV
jgi:hypothetical protein